MDKSLVNNGSQSAETLRIVEEKFRQGEVVLVILEAYQIVGPEHQNRLLAIVQSGNSSALFSFNLFNSPPKNFSDITVNDVFAINGTFFIDVNSRTFGVSSHQFQILSEKIQTTFFYYPDDEICRNKEIFDKILKRLIQEFSEEQRSDFKWLEPYRSKNESEIDVNIALNKYPPKNRESKFKEELDRRKPEYTFYEPYKIYCSTWNVNNRTPTGDFSLKSWLNNSNDAPDIYAIGLQEIDMSPETIVRSENRIDYNWIGKLQEGLYPSAEDPYVHLESCRLVGMMLTVFVKFSLRSKISKVCKSDVGTGTLKFGNKGGVGVSFQLNETYMCFVNAHLAAHVSEVDRRNEDHDEIMRRMSFHDGFKTRSILEHDQIFFIGDLNYRLVETDQEAIRTFIDYEKVFYLDQFHIEHAKKKRIFHGFQEGKITFRPTYKYDSGTDIFDSSEKNRAPAWCDRILWKGVKIEQTLYNSVMDLRISDHKPVFSVFHANILTRDERKFKKVHEEALKTVDKYENDNQPQITVAETDLDFGCIRYHEMCSREILVANNCHLPVHFKFKPKDDLGNICESYIKIHQTEGELLTGNTLSIRVDIIIDEKSASEILNKKLKNCNPADRAHLDILVLHVENGRDIFITIYAQYTPSVFGLKIETLMKLEKPLIEYSIEEIISIEEDFNDDISHNKDITVPREIWLLIDYLYKSGISVRQIITIQRKHRTSPRICAIRDWLDARSIENFPGTPQTAIEALLQIFESLPEPLITIPERDLMIYACNFPRCKDLLLNKTSLVNRRTFLYVVMFIRELQRNFAANNVDDTTILKIFTPALFRHRNDQNSQKFLIQFLCNDISEFVKSVFQNN